MNTLKINTKKGNFEVKNVNRIVTVGKLLFVFYEDKKIKIPLNDIISFEVFDTTHKETEGEG